MTDVKSSLTRSTARASIWSGISTGLNQVMRLAVMIILARLLVPEDFGIVAMADTFTVFVAWVVDLGLAEAIVQRKLVTQRHLSTIFWVGWAMGIFLYLVLVAASPLATYFFHNDLVKTVLIVSATAMAIRPLASVHGALMRKEMKFFSFAVAETGTGVTYLIASVSMALAGLGLWSIVLGIVFSEIMSVVLRWLLYRWKPSFIFGLSELKELMGFGLNITGIRLTQVIGDRLDYMAVGRYMSANALGYYNLGSKVVTFASQLAWTALYRVVFPLFSAIQDDDLRLRRAFMKFMNYLCILSVPFFTGLAIVAPELVYVVFGDKWQAAILPMQILCVSGIAGVIGAVVQPPLLSKGRPDIVLKLSIARLIVLPGFLIIGIRYGMVGVATAVSVATLLLTAVNYLFVNRILNLGMRDLAIAVGPSALGAGVMAIVLLILRHFIVGLGALQSSLLLIVSICVGVVTYYFTFKVFRFRGLDEIIKLFTDIILRRKSSTIE